MLSKETPQCLSKYHYVVIIHGGEYIIWYEKMCEIFGEAQEYEIVDRATVFKNKRWGYYYGNLYFINEDDALLIKMMM